MLTAALARWGVHARAWSRTSDPWSNVYGFARTLIAASTALTLAFNRTSVLFLPGPSGEAPLFCDGVKRAGYFCAFPADRLELSRWIAVALLALVASGWRPRITGMLHWWISFGLHAGARTVDGGDSAAAVLTLLLLPVTLSDPRAWHWQASPAPKYTDLDDARRLFALVALLFVRVQVAGIYFHACIGKLGVEEWTNGTALYYWLQSPMFGASGVVLRALHPLLLNGLTLTLLTWSVLVLEYLLSAALFMPKRFWAPLLWSGIAMHAGIILVHGLVTFSTVMFAALVLYLRPVERPFRFSVLTRAARRAASAAAQLFAARSRPRFAGGPTT